MDHNGVNKIAKYIADWRRFHGKIDSAWLWTRHLWPKSDGQIHPKEISAFSNTKFVDNELFASHHQLNLKTKEGKTAQHRQRCRRGAKTTDILNYNYSA